MSSASEELKSRENTDLVDENKFIIKVEIAWRIAAIIKPKIDLLSSLTFFLPSFILKLSIWTILAPILNLFYFNEVLTDDLPPDYGIRETFSYLDLREKLTKKAIKMQIKWSFILASILAFIGSVMNNIKIIQGITEIL